MTTTPHHYLRTQSLLLALGIVVMPLFAQEPSEPEAPPPPVTETQPPVTPEPPAPTDQALAVPEPYPESRYATTWSRNPFQTKTTTPPHPPASFADDWNLSSVTSAGAVFAVRIRNNKTNESRKLTEKPDAEGFRIVNVSANRDRKLVVAKIAKGSEEADLKFAEIPAGGGAPAATGARAPGQPGIPGNYPGQPRTAAVPGMAPGAPGTAQQQQAALAQQRQQQLTGPGGIPMNNGSAFNRGGPTARTPAPGISNIQGAPATPVQRRRVLIPQPIPPTADGTVPVPVQ